MASGEAICPQFPRHLEQIGEFRPHIAANTGHRRAPRQIFIGKLFDHLFGKLDDAGFTYSDITNDETLAQFVI